MELRDIEIFLTLAEELHFGRTAERLHLTQGRVSQSIKKQERRIGAALFDRDNRNVALTSIGRQLYEDLRPMYQGLREGVDRATMAAQGKTDILRLGMIASNLQPLRPLLDAFEARHPECAVRIRDVHFDDPFGPLRAGDIDVHLLWLPVREPDLTVGPVLYTEPLVLALSTAHPLASRTSVSLEDLAGQTVTTGARPDYWREAVVPARTPSGQSINTGPTVTHYQEMIPIIASGEAMSPVHAQAQRYFPHPDIAYIPIHDAPLARWALVWRTSAETDLIRAFANTAKDAGLSTR
ncbi:LysR family transcriptional regulator [Actinomadura harenae]|uniref:LysR family transcriptional regulator n=1 Tax=Actinomadura harenae TaxID=2483351 RepID=A0A3M2LEL1_9ACTN|nr:LysR family transcriptional regulator [Actinomadura harenae]RMI35961.1 LysR family transcriptional regulator [Actinomadura harenae]